MANITAEELKAEQEFMKDFWAFRKKYYHGEESDGFWDAASEEVNALGKKYNTYFSHGLLLICLDDIEQRYMERIKARGQRTALEKISYVEKTIKALREDFKTADVKSLS